MIKILRENLTKLMNKNNFTKKEFSQKIGITRAYLDRLMNYKNRFNEEIIESICKVLKVEPYMLFLNNETTEIPNELKDCIELMRDNKIIHDAIMGKLADLKIQLGLIELPESKKNVG